MGDTEGTNGKILEMARQEFLEKGFQDASLRTIVRKAGVTTGAFYRYYPTKEALFEALVKPHADQVISLLDQGIGQIQSMTPREQTDAMTQVTADYMDRILDYVYDHYDSFKLLICQAAGTVYENFLHELVEHEVKATYQYMEALKSMGHPVPSLDEGLCHMISSGLFSGMFEMVVHDMNQEDARRRIIQLREFHTGGWERILGVAFQKREGNEEIPERSEAENPGS